MGTIILLVVCDRQSPPRDGNMCTCQAPPILHPPSPLLVCVCVCVRVRVRAYVWREGSGRRSTPSLLSASLVFPLATTVSIPEAACVYIVWACKFLWPACVHSRERKYHLPHLCLQSGATLHVYAYITLEWVGIYYSQWS